jgi:mycothiol synthase
MSLTPDEYHLERSPRSWQVHAPERLAAAPVEAAVATIAAAGGGEAYLWVSRPTEADDALAAAHGFSLGRDLHQLRVPLPLAHPAWAEPLETRPFRPGVDDDAWLAVNNRAFAWHPEQGGWTRETLAETVREAWFDADGFLLHERTRDPDGARLAGFCWTKVHPAGPEHPDALGEIFVIAVDPDFAGLGLGRALTVAGLRWLHDERGITTGMLYVDASNAPAVTLYEQLGFTVDHVDRAYHRVVEPDAGPDEDVG